MSEISNHLKNELLQCPLCHSTEIISIIYGLPSPDSMDAYLDAWHKGVIKGGGCCVSEGMPTHHCKNCKQDFGSLKL